MRLTVSVLATTNIDKKRNQTTSKAMRAPPARNAHASSRHAMGRLATGPLTTGRLATGPLTTGPLATGSLAADRLGIGPTGATSGRLWSSPAACDIHSAAAAAP